MVRRQGRDRMKGKQMDGNDNIRNEGNDYDRNEEENKEIPGFESLYFLIVTVIIILIRRSEKMVRGNE